MVSQKQRDMVLASLAQGKTLRQSCREADVSEPTSILDIVRSDEVYATHYARAREQGYQLMADDILDIADDSQHDKYVDKDGKTKTDQEAVNRSRLMVDSRKWLLAKALPKVYGDRLDLTHSGKIQTGADTLSDSELASIAAQAKPAADKA